MLNLKKMVFTINGVERAVICNPKEDKLSDVLRRIGLTGVKVGCQTGVCGACSVILNNKVARSCTMKISAVKEYSEITTIEGIGSPNTLHPLQFAWMRLGAVQCGFCVPGFIVSAYQLLKENNNPSRDEVRDWFLKHRNICRCTGYKQIIDAVIEASKVLRGEKSIDDLEYKDPKGKNYYGTNITRPAALGKVTGLTDYGDDIELKMPEQTLHAAVVQPRVTSHAKIKKIITDEALKMPGVLRVITAKDVKEAGCSNRVMSFTVLPRSNEKAGNSNHFILAEDKITNYGNIVAVVVARSKSEAKVAAKKVTIEYEQLDEVLNFVDAAKKDAIRVFDDHENVWSMQPTIKTENLGDPKKIKDHINNAPNVVEGSFYSQREPHMPIEGDTVQAYFDEEDNLTVQCKAMFVYFNQEDIATATNIPMEKVRVIENPTGGTFGWGIAGATYSLAAMTSIVMDKMPVALSFTYEEFMHYSGKRAPSYTNAKLACDENGKILGVEFDNGLDHGSFNELGDDLTTRIARFSFFPYHVPNVIGVSRVAASNHAYGTAYRGYGSPQAYTFSESLMDMMAEKLGIDPFKIREINAAKKGDLNLNQFEFKDYPMEELLKKAKPIYENSKKRVEEFNKKRTGEIKMGVGIAFGGYNVTEGTADQCTVAIELTKDNTFIKYDTWQDQGQGGDIGSLMVTLEALRVHFDGLKEISKEDVKLIQNDSRPLKDEEKKINADQEDERICPDHGASASSRSHFMNSKATYRAVEKLKNAMLKSDGTLRTYEEMVAENIPLRYRHQFLNAEFGHGSDEINELMDMDPNTGKGDPTPDYTYAFFISEVSVNIKTGDVKCEAYHSIADVGTIGNIDAVNGQVFGGASHCIGFALTEDYENFDKHKNILGAGIPTAKDVPDGDNFTVTYLDNKRRQNEFGSSGASEAFQSSGHVAIINAINNAVGVRIYSLPATKDKVKDALDKKAKGEDLTPKKYDLGHDFYETIEDIIDNPVKVEE